MDRKIKTRQVHKDIKVLDKTVTVTDHVKQSHVRTKETVMQSTEKSSDRENNPVGYAEDAASKYADRIFHETGHQVRRQAEKLIERKKESFCFFGRRRNCLPVERTNATSIAFRRRKGTGTGARTCCQKKSRPLNGIKEPSRPGEHRNRL